MTVFSCNNDKKTPKTIIVELKINIQKLYTVAILTMAFKSTRRINYYIIIKMLFKILIAGQYFGGGGEYNQCCP